MRSVEASLKRLNTEYIDLLYLHMWDYTSSVGEVMRGLNDLIRNGKIHYIGFSDTPAYIVAKANMLADLQSLSPVEAIQVPYNLMRRDPERELFPMAKEENVSVTAWGLLGGGVLTGKYRDINVDKRYESTSEDRMVVADKMVEIADEIGRSPSQIAINWVRQQQDKAQIIPIIGARSLDQIKDNLGVLDFELSPDQLLEIGSLTDFQAGFPWSFLHEENVLELIHGKTYSKLDHHR